MGIIKTVGSSGQISLGKKFAGQTVLVDEIQAGVWMIQAGRFIPDNEKWVHGPDVQAELNEAVRLNILHVLPIIATCPHSSTMPTPP